jgi:putative ABC transport system permease protein
MRSVTGFKMLVHDRSSTAGAVLGVVAIVFLVGQQLSVFFGLLSYMSVLVDHSGADAWITSQNLENADATGEIPVRYVDRIAGVRDVEWAEPIVLGAGSFRKPNGQFESVRLVGLRRPRFAGGPWAFVEGSNADLFDPEGITVDRIDLPNLGNPGVGDVTEINGRRVRVAAITDKARGFAGTLVFASFETAREISGIPAGRCSAILVKFAPGLDKHSGIERLSALLPSAGVMATEDLSVKTRGFYLANTGIGGSFGFSTVIGTLVGVVIITLTLYASVLNRVGDFAVLRALGARKWDIFVLVMSQAVAIGVIGLFVGFALLALLLNGTRGSPIPSYMPAWVPPIHAAATMLFCLAGSILALRKALQAEPASVFH